MAKKKRESERRGEERVKLRRARGKKRGKRGQATGRKIKRRGKWEEEEERIPKLISSIPVWLNPFFLFFFSRNLQ